MGRAGRSANDDQIGRRNDGPYPFREQCSQPILGLAKRLVAKVTQCITSLPAPTQPHCAEAVEIPTDGRLRDVVAEAAQGGDQLVLARGPAFAQ